jgi:hypothetical protein
MRSRAVLLAAALVVALPGAAHADHDYYGGDEYDQDYSSRDRNRNRGRDRGAFSPDFDRSPVTICLPQSTCNFDGQRGREGEPR